MKSLSVLLNQCYKSFGFNFSVDLNGSFIIHSGINGSGKSQLLDIVAQRDSCGNKKKISAIVKLNENLITKNDIVRRSQILTAIFAYD